MKNKVIKFVLFFVIGFAMLFTIASSNKSKVKAESSFHDFTEFSFVISPNIDLTGEAYWNVKITWKTIEKLKFLEVKMFLEDGHEELVYVDGRENLSTKTFTEVDGGYYYTLQFDITQNQTCAIIPNKLLTNSKRLCQTVWRRLLCIGEVHTIITAIAQQTLKSRQIVWCRDNQYITNPRQHQHADWIINHWFVINRHQLFANAFCDWVQTCSRTSC